MAINARKFRGEKIFEMFGSKTYVASNSKEASGWVQPEKLNFPLRFFRVVYRLGKFPREHSLYKVFL